MLTQSVHKSNYLCNDLRIVKSWRENQRRMRFDEVSCWLFTYLGTRGCEESFYMMKMVGYYELR